MMDPRSSWRRLRRMSPCLNGLSEHMKPLWLRKIWKHNQSMLRTANAAADAIGRTDRGEDDGILAQVDSVGDSRSLSRSVDRMGRGIRHQSVPRSEQFTFDRPQMGVREEWPRAPCPANDCVPSDLQDPTRRVRGAGGAVWLLRGHRVVSAARRHVCARPTNRGDGVAQRVGGVGLGYTALPRAAHLCAFAAGPRRLTVICGSSSPDAYPPVTSGCLPPTPSAACTAGSRARRTCPSRPCRSRRPRTPPGSPRP